MNTTFDYIFRHNDLDKQLKTIRKYERLSKDCEIKSVTITQCSDFSTYAEITISVKPLYPVNNDNSWLAITFQYTEDDKQLFLCDYLKFRDNMEDENHPFYNNPIYYMLDYMHNGAGKFTDLYNAIQYIRMVQNVINATIKESE